MPNYSVTNFDASPFVADKYFTDPKEAVKYARTLRSAAVCFFARNFVRIEDGYVTTYAWNHFYLGDPEEGYHELIAAAVRP